MPNRTSDASTTSQIILDLAWRQCDQQSSSLDSHKRQAVLIAGAYLSTGTLTMAALAAAVAASSRTLDFALTIRTAVVVLGWSFGLSIIAALVQLLAQRWEGEFSIEQLISDYAKRASRNRVLELDIAATLEKHYLENKRYLYRIRWCLAVQAVAAAVGVVILIQRMLSLA